MSLLRSLTKQRNSSRVVSELRSRCRSQTTQEVSHMLMLSVRKCDKGSSHNNERLPLAVSMG